MAIREIPLKILKYFHKNLSFLPNNLIYAKFLSNYGSLQRRNCLMLSKLQIMTLALRSLQGIFSLKIMVTIEKLQRLEVPKYVDLDVCGLLHKC